jgi:hypothetical protein
LPDGQFCEIRVQPSRKKYFACAVGQITAVSHPIRGTFRDRHERWARDAMDAQVPPTNGINADGKVVWS